MKLNEIELQFIYTLKTKKKFTLRCAEFVVCRAVLPSTASPGGGWGNDL